MCCGWILSAFKSVSEYKKSIIMVYLSYFSTWEAKRARYSTFRFFFS